MSHDNIKLPSLPFLTREMLKFGGDAKIELQINSQSDATTSCLIRGLTREGPFIYNHIPTNNSIIKTENFPIPDFPIMMTVTDGDGVLIQGQTFITMRLLINGDVYQELCAGWVYRQKALSYPDTNASDLRPGGGFLGTETVADPAAGAEASITVPSGEVWRLMAFRVTLVSDATSTNRRVHLVVTDGTNDLINHIGQDNQPASLTKKYSFNTHGFSDTGGQDDDVQIAIAQDLTIPSGFTLETQTVNLQAGDNFGAPIAYIERYFTPA